MERGLSIWEETFQAELLHSGWSSVFCPGYVEEHGRAQSMFPLQPSTALSDSFWEKSLLIVSPSVYLGKVPIPYLCVTSI